MKKMYGGVEIWQIVLLILLILVIIIVILVVNFSNQGKPLNMALISGACDLSDIFEMKKLWDTQAALFREWTIAKVNNGTCLTELNDALMQNQVAIANNFARFSDTTTANRLSNYLQTHIIQGSQLVNMILNGIDQIQVDRLYEEWKNNARLVSRLLSEKIRTLDSQELENLFFRYLNSTIEQTRSIVDKKCDITKFLINLDNETVLTSYLAKHLKKC